MLPHQRDQDALNPAGGFKDVDPAEELPHPVGNNRTDTDSSQNRLKRIEEAYHFHFADQVLPFQGFQAPVYDHHKPDQQEPVFEPGFRHEILK